MSRFRSDREDHAGAVRQALVGCPDQDEAGECAGSVQTTHARVTTSGRRSTTTSARSRPKWLPHRQADRGLECDLASQRRGSRLEVRLSPSRHGLTR
jgi:hypothetical protein